MSGHGRSWVIVALVSWPYVRVTLTQLLLLASLTANGGPSESVVRPMAGRTVEPGDPTVRQALDYLGQRIDPIEVVSLAEATALYGRVPRAGAPSPGVNAFRLPLDGAISGIFVNRESVTYRLAARRPTVLRLLRLAATLLHEQVHRSDGEHAAYRLQADFVRSRLRQVPRRERAEAERYLEGLETRAAVFRRLRR